MPTDEARDQGRIKVLSGADSPIAGREATRYSQQANLPYTPQAL